MSLAAFKKYKLVLASKSPRRQELLRSLGVAFEVRTKEIEEIFPDTLQREEVARYLAQLKANAFTEELAPGELIITSDTTVCLGDQILNKPQDRNEAISMLQSLSGKSHQVITAVCLKTLEKAVVFHESTTVHFKTLSRAEIEYYVDHYQPYDKAGSYGIQEWIGYVGIKGIEGDYFNVVGLPVHALYHQISQF